MHPTAIMTTHEEEVFLKTAQYYLSIYREDRTFTPSVYCEPTLIEVIHILTIFYYRPWYGMVPEADSEYVPFVE